MVKGIIRKSAKRELNNLEIKEKRKKQKKDDAKSDKKEMKKLRKSIKELTGIMKELQEIIQSKADDVPVVSFKEEEAPVVEPKDECNFGNKDHLINFDSSLLVSGFDTSVPGRVMKKSLWKHFESCGKVKTVYVPIECATGRSFGYAFVQMQNGLLSKGFKLHGTHFRGERISVECAKFKPEVFGHPDQIGCASCSNYMPWLARRRRPYIIEPIRNWRIVGTPSSQIGRFTANIGRLFN